MRVRASPLSTRINCAPLLMEWRLCNLSPMLLEQTLLEDGVITSPRILRLTFPPNERGLTSCLTVMSKNPSKEGLEQSEKEERTRALERMLTAGNRELVIGKRLLPQRTTRPTLPISCPQKYQNATVEVLDMSS